MNDIKRRRKIGLALGTGAARGLAHIGVIKVLEETGIKVDYIAGASMGAMIGGGYAVTLDIKKIESIALETDWRKLFSLVDLALPLNGIIDGRKIQEFIKSSIGDAKFSDAKIPLTVVATEVPTGERIILKEGNIARAVRASVSIPILFTPYNYEGRFLIDGGVVDPVPVRLVREMGADFVIAVNLFSDLKRYFSEEKPSESKSKKLSKLQMLKEIIPPGPIRAKADEIIFNRIDRILKTPTLVGTGMQTIAIMERHLAIPQLMEADVVITPEVGDIGSIEYVRAGECIARGEEAAKQILARTLK
ncbi:MAG: patatin-like phospholipase family protein [Candidatus Margulisiibacteriota bacterium]|nr:patatin-like phospholipase family protein [Candidatus Margulisiibacteriota bacterium]